MKITIISMIIPYPAMDGGRIDVWRRIKALAELGIDLQLVCWSPETPTPENVAVIEKYVQSFYPICFKSTFGSLIRRAVDLLSYPLEVTSRIIRGTEWSNLLNTVRAFEPDVILADHVHCGVVALPLSQQMDVPMIVRSHDIEHLHYRYLLKSAKGYRKFQRLLSLNHLERYEKSILKQSLAFYDISVNDLQFWKEQGFTNGHFLPPLIEFPEEINDSGSQVSAHTNLSYDVVFLGNLMTDNNISGITWFLEGVFPLLRDQLPTIKVLIAGSNPSLTIQKLLEKTNGVDLKINPASAMEIYKSGRVLVNPVATGSGVSIKSIDMLAVGKPIVTLPKGLYGLPEEAKQCFRVATDAQSFAGEILKCLSEEVSSVPDQELLNSLFGYSVIEKFLSNLSALI